MDVGAYVPPCLAIDDPLERRLVAAPVSTLTDRCLVTALSRRNADV